ncbi:cell division cycle-associated protein 3-like [Portunus trituberculatus]|uniref:cell division cycle-associated protein 3-like n=1 Tax=Portunus trituberculatus TaxID=210409 RepID=UPI001E1CF2A4|nr:cell division cycle-associated protein 3-like [Portunus trituberculatus]
MGGLTSKYLEEMMHTPPRSTHVLKSDPRSPSDNITRTPISVTDTPERGSNGTPATKVLPFDPRSPSTELERTPIVVETKETRRRPFSLKPSRLIDPSTVAISEDLDPRSPTSRVPRTPLSDQTHSFTNKEVSEDRLSGKEVQGVEKEEKGEEEKDNQDDHESSVSSSSSNEENKEVLSEMPQKELLSLTGSNKRSMNTSRNPQSILQARQCQAIEAEYTKNQQVIFTQLAEETKTPTLPSNTQFVENI